MRWISLVFSYYIYGSTPEWVTDKLVSLKLTIFHGRTDVYIDSF